MIVVLHNPMYRLIAAGVSIAIVLILYFAVISPSNNTANTAVRNGEAQAVQAVKQANQQSGGAVPANVVNLTSCVAAAGTDSSALQACKAKFKP